MKILVLNCGSSSIKYQLIDMPSQDVLAKGLIEKIGLKDSLIIHKRCDGKETCVEGEIPDHTLGISKLLEILMSAEYGSIKNYDEIFAVGHRVVHGGEKFSSSILLTDEVIKVVEDLIDLAPLHNPANLKGIYAIQKILPNVKQVGVFDTAFHQTLPKYAFLYALPYEYYEKYHVRKFGFHGTSHKYVSKRAAEIDGRDYSKLKIITCHLGNGASIAAVKNGLSVETSMGFTPVEGLFMGTRTGDLDLGAILYIMEKEKMDIKEVNNMINKKSGMLGISGVSSDMRDLLASAKDGNERAQVALQMYAYQVKKYIGAYAAVMNGVDIIVFTGGIGENDCITRFNIMQGFDYLGVKMDEEKCKTIRSKEEYISTPDSKVKVMIVPTNEELVIAQDTLEIVTK